MNWKIKAFIQNCYAALPENLSYEMYFQMQRYFGGLKKPFNPLAHFSKAVDIVKKIKQYGYETRGKYFLRSERDAPRCFRVLFGFAGQVKP